MASRERQKVKFTGKRTGLEAIAIKGIGRVEAGETIEIDSELAEQWTQKLPMRDDKTGSDWSKVGGSFSVSEDEVSGRELKQREKVAADADDDLYVNAANDDYAHEPDAGTGTVEEQAEALIPEDDPDK